MPLQLPNLDDRRYTDLAEEARTLIPTYAPEWTNHNPSDPGITLMELFAFLSEMLIYRLNRVTAANILSFLKLLNGTDWNPFEEEERKLTDSQKADIAARLKQLAATELAQLIAQQLPKTILKLRRLERAVSCSDFESLGLEADTRVQRVRCVPRCNIEVDPEQEKPGHVSIIILPRSETEPNLPGLIATVKNFLTPKLLLTTQLHVVGPQLLTVGMKATVVPLSDEQEPALQQRIVDAVKKFFDPRTGGDDGQGWPFGRNVFVSEMYSLLDQLPGVDYVIMGSITLTPATPGRLISSTTGELIGADVKPYELVKAQVTTADVTVQTP
jgi:baseplate J-like protein